MPISRQYTASAGAVFKEALPHGYRSAILTNQSGHYALVRLGAQDVPSGPGAADRIIPPYSIASFVLSSPYVAGVFTDTVIGLAGSVATGSDGVCEATYSKAVVQEGLVGLPGATQQVVIPPPPTAYQWLRVSKAATFAAPNATVQILAGPATVRYARLTPLSEAGGAGRGLIYSALASTPTLVDELLAGGPVNKYATVPAYLPDVEWGPVIAGAEVTIDISHAIFATCDQTMAAALVYAEYRVV